MGAGFDVKDVFDLDGALEQLFDAWERARGADNAGFDGIAGALEVVPSEMLNVWAQDEICVAFPGFELMLLGSGNGAGDNLKDVFGSAAVAVLHANGNGKDPLSAQLTRSDGGDLRDETAVREATSADFHGFEEARKRAACANGINETALREDDRIASGQICGYDSHGNAQVFELARFEDAVHQIRQTMVAGKAEPRDAPTRDITKLKVAARGKDFRQGRAASVGCAENAANACARYMSDGNVILFENLQDAEMRKATRESSAESEPDARTRFCGACFAADWEFATHVRRMPEPA